MKSPSEYAALAISAYQQRKADNTELPLSVAEEIHGIAALAAELALKDGARYRENLASALIKCARTNANEPITGVPV